MLLRQPFVAEKLCLSCHVNSKLGDILAILDLRYDLNHAYDQIFFRHAPHTGLYFGRVCGDRACHVCGV
ncbi:hypothetical protein HBZS_111720 [Helicobacter bizzozeronii CCUG 35545]|nr:hypothetical protein HBZS_111720 [Helicobacter bizzozeronii CCUG 35545]